MKRIYLILLFAIFFAAGWLAHGVKITRIEEIEIDPRYEEQEQRVYPDLPGGAINDLRRGAM